MGLRGKIVIPLLVLGAGLVAYIGLLWMPSIVAAERQQHMRHFSAQAALLGEALIEPMLQQNYSAVNSTLEGVLNRTPEWEALVLSGADGRVLYPVAPSAELDGSGPHQALLRQPVEYLGERLGTLEVLVSLEQLVAADKAEVRRLQWTLFLALGAALVFLGVFLDRKVRAPLAALVQAARAVGDGEFGRPLPAAPTDEVGALVASFDDMRRAVQQNREDLEREAREHENTRRETERSLEVQQALACVLETSLEPGALGDILDSILSTVLSLPWLAVEPRGAIFLAQEDVLVLAAQRNLPQEVAAQCSIVPFGQCLCGRSAAEREPIFSSHVDERHEFRFPGMTPHGHLIAPITSKERLLGVVNLYLQDGAAEREEHSEFVSALASTLAGIIERKEVEAQAFRQAHVIDQVEDAVIGMDCAGFITSWNHAAVRLFDYDRHGIVGQDLAVLLDETGKQWWRREVLDSPESHGRIQNTVVMHRSDGNAFMARLSVSTLQEETGVQTGLVAYVMDVSDYRRVQSQLEASEERFRCLVETTSDWVWEVNAEGRYTYVSPRIRDLLGYEPSEVLGKTPFDLMPHAEAQRIQQIFAQIAARSEPFSRLKNVNRHRDGREVVLETSGVPYFDTAGELLGYRGIDRDVTERHKAESALQESEAKYRALMENASDAIFLAVPGGPFVEANRQAERLLGCSREEILQLTPFDIHPEDEHDNVRRAFQDIGAKGYSLYEHTVVRKDGTRVCVEVAGTLLSYGDETLALGVFRDITERKQAEERLRQLNENLEARVRERTTEVQNQKLALDHHSIVGITDRRGRIIYVNDKFCEISGYTRQELIGQDHRILNSGYHPRSFFKRMWRTIGNGKVWQGEIRNLTKTGDPYWVETTIVPFMDENDKPYQYVSVRSDITGVKRAQYEQERRHVRLRAQQQALMRLARGRVFVDGSLEGVLREISEVGAQTLDVSRVSIWFHEAGKGAVECHDLFDNRNQRHSAGQRLERSEQPRFFSQLENNLLIVVEDVNSEDEARDVVSGYCVPHDVTAFMSAPVRIEGRVRGVVCFEHSGGVRSWHTDEQHFGNALADVVALAVEQVNRKQAEDRLAESARQLERMNLDLKSALDDAQAAARAKSEFLATMSHEIRTPMNGVLGMLDLVLADDLKPHLREEIEIAHRSAGSLMRILNDLIDLSKVEAGRLELEQTTVEPAQLVGDVCNLMRPVAEGKGLELRCALDADLPVQMMGDPTRLRQIVTNLVSNAVKFTETGAVTVRAGQDIAAGRREVLYIEVSDTGIGIDPNDRVRIFETFSQADGSTTRRFGGAGLGLSICKQLIERMGGEIGVESEPSEGSTFWCRIPLRSIPAQEDRMPTAVVAEPLGTRSARVLVVDDNEINRRVADRMLRELGHCVESVADGSAALEYLRQTAVDIVLMDCEMPGMDGYLTAQMIREAEGADELCGGPLHIVAITAHGADEVVREQCLGAGMDDCVGKPLDGNALGRLVEQWTGIQARSGSVDESVGACGANAAASPLDTATFAGLQELLAEELDELVDLFLRDSPPHVASMRQALEREDYCALRDMAHSLKGTSANLGASALSDACRILEQSCLGDAPDQASDKLAAVVREHARALEFLGSLRGRKPMSP